LPRRKPCLDLFFLLDLAKLCRHQHKLVIPSEARNLLSSDAARADRNATSLVISTEAVEGSRRDPNAKETHGDQPPRRPISIFQFPLSNYTPPMFQPTLFNNRAIFISGGGSGLGRSMALKFAELGAQIFIIGRREQPLKDVCEEIRRAGGSAGYATADVREPAAVESAVAAAFNQFGRIDTLVNNAAGNFMARTETLSPNAFNAVIGIVLNGSFNCTQALSKRWIADKQGGNILNIVTTYAAANSGSAFVVPSACAKAGVLAMTTSLAVEWAKYKIRVNAIAPGPFPTEGAWSRLIPSKQFEEHARESHPMKRFGRHEELTNLAAFLLSDMSEYINGECVVIDGALWLRGAGEFNDLLSLPESAWQAMESARAKKS
jgi:NAD(P)-dependent dehydrogenase (short-subunit alcohol dehydrogenase family)